MGQEPAAPLVTASDGRTDVAGSSREAGCAWCALGSPCAGGKKTNGTRNPMTRRARRTRPVIC
eukprot:scaffold1183_cov57-Phaeocystis_antarctica.AAC.1